MQLSVVRQSYTADAKDHERRASGSRMPSRELTMARCSSCRQVAGASVRVADVVVTRCQSSQSHLDESTLKPPSGSSRLLTRISPDKR